MHIMCSFEWVYRGMAYNFEPLGFFKKLKLKAGFRVYLGHLKMPGWRGELPFYAFVCPKHGVKVSYPSGFRGRLICDECQKELSAAVA